MRKMNGNEFISKERDSLNRFLDGWKCNLIYHSIGVDETQTQGEF